MMIEMSNKKRFNLKSTKGSIKYGTSITTHKNFQCVWWFQGTTTMQSSE
jgi:hypothetical protein